MTAVAVAAAVSGMEAGEASVAVGVRESSAQAWGMYKVSVRVRSRVRNWVWVWVKPPHRLGYRSSRHSVEAVLPRGGVTASAGAGGCL